MTVLLRFGGPSISRSPLAVNADSHGIVPDDFDLKIAGDAQFPCTVL